MAAPSLQPARPATLRLAFAPDPLSVRAVALAIRDFLAEQGVPEKELFSCELCIDEAGSNAISYAVGSARELQPVAEALATPDQIELRVTDYTAGFLLPDPVPQPTPLSEGGRGLFLIQAAMDEVRYLRGPKENILIMRKRRCASPSAATEREHNPGRAPSPEGARPPPESTSGTVATREEFDGDETAKKVPKKSQALFCALWRLLAVQNSAVRVPVEPAPHRVSSPPIRSRSPVRI